MKSLSINSQYLQSISTSVKIEPADNCQFIKPNFCLLHVCHHMHEPLKGHDSTWLKARQEIPGITLVSAIKTSNRLCVWLSHWVGHQHHLLCVNNSFLWCISSTDPLRLYIRQSLFRIFKNKDNNNKDHDLIRILDAMKSISVVDATELSWDSLCFFRLWDSSEGFKGLPGLLPHSCPLEIPFPPVPPPSLSSSPPILSLDNPPSSKMNTGSPVLISDTVVIESFC